MKDYASRLPKAQNIKDNTTNFYSHNNNMMSSIEDIEFATNNIHTVENSYEQQEKLKEILTRSLD